MRMRWLKRKLAKWVNDANCEVDEVCCESPKVSAQGVGGNGSNFRDPMNITIYNATGGKIIKFMHYNHKTHDERETIYLVHTEENFEDALTKFMTVEAMKM